MRSVYKEICRYINNGTSVVLVTALNKREDTLNSFGTQMLVTDDYSIIGSIGGGLMEAMAVRLTKRVFDTGEPLVTVLDSGMPMGFATEVMLEYIGAEDGETVRFFNGINNFIHNNMSFLMVTRLHKVFNGYQIKRELVFENDYYKLDAGFRDKLLGNGFSRLQFSIIREDQDIIVAVPIFNRENAYIFGAGYIAQRLCQITGMLDFNTIILDTREEFANRKRFPEADNIIVLKSFGSLGRFINIDENSYIIIVTRGHRDDTEVLSQVIRSEAKYVGMIGSRKKRDAAYSELLGLGFLPGELEKVHSPIGININGKTPEEITVSIAAELVKVRREK